MNPKCRRGVRQAGEGEILRAKIGPQIARGIFLRFHIGLTYRKVVCNGNVEQALRPSRSDATMVAVGFNPRFAMPTHRTALRSDA